MEKRAYQKQNGLQEENQGLLRNKKNTLDCCICASRFHHLKYNNPVTFIRSISVASLEVRLKCFGIFRKGYCKDTRSES